MKLQQLSVIAEDFPDLPVEYTDMTSPTGGWRYRFGGRSLEQGIDCLGVVLEIFRRAGIGIPDPGEDPQAFFLDLWDSVAEPDRLFDVVRTTRGDDHLWIVVAPGLALTASAARQVTVDKIGNLKRIKDGIRFYRIKDAVLP